MINLLSGLPNDRIIKQDPSFFILFSLSFSFHFNRQIFSIRIKNNWKALRAETTFSL